MFNAFNNLKVLIIGDVMVDAYFWGNVDRISPEAPVPIVEVEKKEKRLGGAANVALNVQALGAEPILCSVIGDDSDSNDFMSLLEKRNLSDKGIIKDGNRLTTVKTRVIGNNHQMMRIDSETREELNAEQTEQLVQNISGLLDSQNIDVIIFEDYDKGVITESLISKVVELARKHNIPTTVDPKKRNFLDYKGVTLFKPNLKELKEGLNIELKNGDVKAIDKAVSELSAHLNNDITFITLSEYGVYINDKDNYHHIPAHVRDIADVSGAGDTVISVASLCLALGQHPKIIAEIANLAGGLVCEKVGVVPVDKDQLYSESISNLL